MPAQTSAEKKQEWQNIILRQRQSGLSINRWCQENHIATSVFYYWQKKLFPSSLSVALVLPNSPKKSKLASPLNMEAFKSILILSLTLQA